MSRVCVLRSAVDPSGAGKQFDLAAPHLRERSALVEHTVGPGPNAVRVARAAADASPDLVHTLGPEAFRAMRSVALERLRPGAKLPKWLASGCATVEPPLGVVPGLTATLSEYEYERDWSARVLPAPMQFSYRPAVPPPLPRETGDGGVRSRQVILAAGEFDEFANLRLAVWAFDVLKYARPDVHLVLLGDGPQRAEVEGFARQLAGDDYRVRFAGHVADVRPYLAQAALVFGTHTRGGVKFLLEAQAAGVPVVAGETPDTRRVIEHGETGLMVPLNRAVRMAEEAHRLLLAPDRRRAMVVRGEGAAAGYSVPDLARAWAGVYHTLTSPAQPPRE